MCDEDPPDTDPAVTARVRVAVLARALFGWMLPRCSTAARSRITLLSWRSVVAAARLLLYALWRSGHRRRTRVSFDTSLCHCWVLWGCVAYLLPLCRVVPCCTTHQQPPYASLFAEAMLDLLDVPGMLTVCACDCRSCSVSVVVATVMTCRLLHRTTMLRHLRSPF